MYVFQSLIINRIMKYILLLISLVAFTYLFQTPLTGGELSKPSLELAADSLRKSKDYLQYGYVEVNKDWHIRSNGQNFGEHDKINVLLTK